MLPTPKKLQLFKLSRLTKVTTVRK